MTPPPTLSEKSNPAIPKGEIKLEGSRPQSDTKRKRTQQEFTAFDRELIHAAKEKLPVLFVFSESVDGSGEQGQIRLQAVIKSVDTYFLEIWPEGSEKTTWVNKGHIVSARVEH